MPIPRTVPALALLLAVGGATAAAQSPSPNACTGLVTSALARAPENRPEAERLLVSATRQCPKDPAAWRALARLRLLDSKWKAAEHFAHRAADLAPDDTDAWDLVARSRYLSGDVRGALRSWNHLGRPVIDQVEIHGARHADPAVVLNLVGLTPGELLTNDRFLRAWHRLDQFPVSFDSRLKYSVSEDGRARVDVYLDERDVVPSGGIQLAAVGASGLAFQDLRLEAASPTGHGEDFTGSWGWEPNWRHVTVGLEVPAPGKLPGLASIRASWERQVFAPAPNLRTVGDRQQVMAGFSNWAASWLRWQASAGMDRFSDRTYASVSAGLEGRFIRDHVAVNAEAGGWAPAAGGPTFTTTTAWLSTRSTTRIDRPIWLTVFGAATAGRAAPFELWTGAGSSEAGEAYLRAHPLIRNGAVRGEVFGRQLAFGSVEYQHPIWQSPAGPISVAGFVDAAQARQRAASLPDTPVLVDVGMGLRLRPPAVAGVLRFDVARGVRDGRIRASIGFLERWPRR
jgi:hypothetical protein